MRKYLKGCALTLLLLGASSAMANEFDGLYMGMNVGSNKSTVTGQPDKSGEYMGLVAGYNWDLQNYLLGVNAFVDTHDSSYSGQDGGLDVKLGLPMNHWLPYAKLGMATTAPGGRIHGGLGVEYKLADKWSISGEWMTDSKSSDGRTYKNDNFLIGLNFYFAGGKKGSYQ